MSKTRGTPREWRPSDREVAEALTAARSLKDQLDAAGFGEDAKLLLDSLEGEADIDIPDLLDRLVFARQEAKAYAAMTHARMQELSARKESHNHNRELLDGAISKIMEAVRLKYLKRPCHTISIGDGVQHVHVSDVEELDPRFVRVTKEPMKREIKEEFDAGRKVKGAILSNPQPVLRIVSAR